MVRNQPAAVSRNDGLKPRVDFGGERSSRPPAGCSEPVRPGSAGPGDVQRHFSGPSRGGKPGSGPDGGGLAPNEVTRQGPYGRFPAWPFLV